MFFLNLKKKHKIRILEHWFQYSVVQRSLGMWADV